MACSKYPMMMGLLIVFVVLFMMRRCTSGYSMSPPFGLAPTHIDINSAGGDPPSHLFDLPYKLDCTPGKPDGAYYTKDLTPGGLCGGQKFVDAATGYTITGGIGGPLISQ